MTIHPTDIKQDIGYSSAQTVSTASNKAYSAIVKRVLDVVLVTLSLPVLIPLVGFIAILVAMDGHSPFYRQSRVGRDGKSFTMWKLRTMVANADQKLEAYLQSDPEARREWDESQKLKNDPRVTWIGGFLRKSSMDELPQLFNVLIGDMSLVGPRPMMDCQKDLYPGTSYYDLRPGITGLWQISDRNQCMFSERARYDDRYAREISFMTDLRILMKTVAVVIRGTGY